MNVLYRYHCVFLRYFSLQATMPLGFSDKIRFHVEQNICREDESGPQPDCFDKPNKIVYNFLNKVHCTCVSFRFYHISVHKLLRQSKQNQSQHSRYMLLALSPGLLIVAAVL